MLKQEIDNVIRQRQRNTATSANKITSPQQTMNIKVTNASTNSMKDESDLHMNSTTFSVGSPLVLLSYDGKYNKWNEYWYSNFKP